MGKMRLGVLFGLVTAVIGVMTAIQTANATAIVVPIRNAIFLSVSAYLDSSYVDSSGIVFGVESSTETTTRIISGDASVDLGGTDLMIQGSAFANPGGHAFGTYTISETVKFTNESGLDLDYLIVGTSYSAFNPGGSPLGARVDNTALEFARFTSSL